MDLKYEALVDDPTNVPPGDVIYRRVAWHHIGGRDRCPPGELARLNGNAFSDYKESLAAEHGYPAPCMSVAVGSVLSAFGKLPEELLEGFPDFGLAAFSVDDARSLQRKNGDPCPQGVMLAPEEAEPWHAVVFDLAGGPRKTPVKEALAAKASWIVPLTND